MLHPTLDELLDEEDLSPAFEDGASQERENRSSLCSAAISTLHPKAPLALTSAASLKEAIECLQSERRAALLVVDNGVLKGILTERDVLDRVAGRDLDLELEHLRDYMTPDPEVLSLEDPIAFVLNRMTVGGYRHVPIVDADNRPSGIVSVKDVIQYIVDAKPCEVYNLRPEPLHKGFDSPEGA